MKKYNLSHIMTKAWTLFRKTEITFSEALHRSWLSVKAAEINQMRIEEVKSVAGVNEEINTRNGWNNWGMK